MIDPARSKRRHLGDCEFCIFFRSHGRLILFLSLAFRESRGGLLREYGMSAIGTR